jgi:hypothetical protein
MTVLYQNPLPQRVLYFHYDLTHPKNSLMLILWRKEPVVCLHYERQQTTPTGVPLVKNRLLPPRLAYALIAFHDCKTPYYAIVAPITQRSNRSITYINFTIMKKAIRNLGIALIALTLGFSTVTLANDGDKDKTNHTSELKFIGNLENQPVFQLDAHTEEDEITVTFRDEAGNIIYVNTFKGANISKKFMLKSEEFGDTALNVSVKSKKNNSTEVYTINRSHTYVEETTVNKLK